MIAGPETVDGRTDATGLFTTSLERPGTAVVLAEKGGSWAIASLETLGTEVSPGSRSTPSSIDRCTSRETLSVCGPRPATPTGSRSSGTGRSGSRGRSLSPRAARTDEDGILVAELEVPPFDADAWAGGLPIASAWTVWGVPPGEASPLEIASFSVAPRDPGGRTLAGRIDGDGAVLEVRGPAGEPVAGVPVVWDEGSG